MVESNIEPAEMYIDKIENGRARLLCRWNIVQIERTDDTATQLMWQYDEKALWWTFPFEYNGLTLNTFDNVCTYIQSNSTEIMNFAKGAKISIDIIVGEIYRNVGVDYMAGKKRKGCK